MYLRIGQKDAVALRDVVGIFDMDNSTASYITRGTLAHCEKERKIVAAGSDLPRSFIICSPREKPEARRRHGDDKNRNTEIYISQVSSQTLQKRADSGTLEE
jgi:hypothetical protein